MPDYDKGCQKSVYRDHNGREPAYGIGRNRSHIRIEPVQDIAVPILNDLAPAGIHDLIIDICLDIVAYPNAQFGRKTLYQIRKNQGRQRADQNDHHHDTQLVRLIAGYDVDQIFRRNRGNQTKRSAKDSDQGIKEDRPPVFPAVGKDPPPVIQDLSNGPVTNMIEYAAI